MIIQIYIQPFQSIGTVQKSTRKPLWGVVKNKTGLFFFSFFSPFISFFLFRWGAVWSRPELIKRGTNLRSPISVWLRPVVELVSVVQSSSALFEKWKSTCSSLLFLWPAVCDYPHTAKNDHHSKLSGIVITLKSHLPLQKKENECDAMG